MLQIWGILLFNGVMMLLHFRNIFRMRQISSNPNLEEYVTDIISSNTSNLSILNKFYKNELLPIHNDLIETFKNILYEFIFRETHRTLDDLDTICSELITESGKILKADLIKRQKLLG